jgi:hypothetical protein
VFEDDWDYDPWEYLEADDDRLSCGCCSCCGCSCNEPDDDETIEAPPPEPYQMWLFVELEPKTFNDILKRLYVPAINEQLNRTSLLWELLKRDSVSIGSGPFQIPIKFVDERYRNQDSG